MRAFLAIGLMGVLASPACSAAGATAGAAGSHCPAETTAAIAVQGASLCVSIDEQVPQSQYPVVREWIERSARIVAAYYAGFPAPLVVLRIQGAPGGSVHGGRTTNESGLMIQVTVGRDATA